MAADLPSDSPLRAAELIGGPERRVIAVVDYDATWPEIFELHRQRILDALGDRARRVDHMGSTSVPGLAAKPIVDIQLSVPDVEHEVSYLPALHHAGYELRVREVRHRMLRTPQLDVHVHVCDAGSDWERRHLLFRDWLRRSPDDRERYAATKRGLASEDWPTMEHYSHAKTQVIGEITARAEAWARRVGWTVC